jgi:hypothetical protein
MNRTMIKVALLNPFLLLAVGMFVGSGQPMFLAVIFFAPLMSIANQLREKRFGKRKNSQYGWWAALVMIVTPFVLGFIRRVAPEISFSMGLDTSTSFWIFYFPIGVAAVIYSFTESLEVKSGALRVADPEGEDEFYQMVKLKVQARMNRVHFGTLLLFGFLMCLRGPGNPTIEWIGSNLGILLIWTLMTLQFVELAIKRSILSEHQ